MDKIKIVSFALIGIFALSCVVAIIIAFINRGDFEDFCDSAIINKSSASSCIDAISDIKFG